MFATPIEQPTIVSVIQFQTTKISQICSIFKSFRPQKSLLRCKAREQSYLMFFSSVSFKSGHIATCLLHFAEDSHFLYSSKRNLMLKRKVTVVAFFQGRSQTLGKDEAIEICDCYDDLQSPKLRAAAGVWKIFKTRRLALEINASFKIFIRDFIQEKPISLN